MFDKRTWYLKNKDRILSEKKQKYDQNKAMYQTKSADYYWKNRTIVLQNKKQQDQQIKEKLQMLIGSKCIVCNSEIKIIYHEIHGIRHPFRTYILNYPKDFVPLCRKCHVEIHRFINLKINTDILVQLIRKQLS